MVGITAHKQMTGGKLAPFVRDDLRMGHLHRFRFHSLDLLLKGGQLLPAWFRQSGQEFVLRSRFACPAFFAASAPCLRSGSTCGAQNGKLFLQGALCPSQAGVLRAAHSLAPLRGGENGGQAVIIRLLSGSTYGR